MKREQIIKKLLIYGYKQNTIDKLLQGKIRPTANKMFDIEDKQNIPVSAWRNIKSFLNSNENDTKKDKHSSRGKGKNIPQEREEKSA